MNKWEKEVQQSLLDSEAEAIQTLEKQYKTALTDINKKIKDFQAEIELLDNAMNQDGLDDAAKALLQSRKRSKVYQKQYQEALKGQVSGILDRMQGDNYSTIEGYLQKSYEDGYVGTMYDISMQGVPIISPIDQAAAVKAILLDSKVSKGLYSRLGVEVAGLKKTITQEISRGIASGLSYSDIARNISNVSKAPISRTKTITRTEGHRIQQTSTADAQAAAKAKGADVVKQWDAALDGKTRPSHRRVDGEIRELDEKFSNGLMFPGDSSGAAGEVINCRCTSDTRARWALDGGFSKMNNFTKQIETFESPESYAEFKKAFFSDENVKYMNYVQQMEEKYGTKNFAKVLDSMTDREYKNYSTLLANNPVYNKKKQLENSGKSDKMNIGIQFFANKSIAKQTDRQLKKSISSWESAIDIHSKKIANPAAYDSWWETKTDEQRNGLINHWKKEMNNFQNNIDEAKAEIKKRGRE